MRLNLKEKQMHSIHLEFNTIQELENFMAARQPYTVPNFDGLEAGRASPIPVGTCVPVNVADSIRTLEELLNDSNYEWRKVSTVTEKTGLREADMIEYFNKEGIDFEITTGNQGARLVKANY